jgi:hypothetical protein
MNGQVQGSREKVQGSREKVQGGRPLEIEIKVPQERIDSLMEQARRPLEIEIKVPQERIDSLMEQARKLDEFKRKNTTKTSRMIAAVGHMNKVINDGMTSYQKAFSELAFTLMTPEQRLQFERKLAIAKAEAEAREALARTPLGRLRRAVDDLHEAFGNAIRNMVIAHINRLLRWFGIPLWELDDPEEDN